MTTLFSGRTAFVACLLSLLSGRADALSIAEFAAICDSSPGPCQEIPVIQAYIGGALDLIAMLDEETDYLATIYCRPPRDFFDVGDIIRYFEERRNDRPERNAMLLLVRYLEEKGGCVP